MSAISNRVSTPGTVLDSGIFSRSHSQSDLSNGMSIIPIDSSNVTVREISDKVSKAVDFPQKLRSYRDVLLGQPEEDVDSDQSQYGEIDDLSSQGTKAPAMETEGAKHQRTRNESVVENLPMQDEANIAESGQAASEQNEESDDKALEDVIVPESLREEKTSHNACCTIS